MILQNSEIWFWFRHAGNACGNFCVSDGPFANTQLNYLNRHCLRREWNRDGTISPLEAPEWLSVVNQIEVLPDFARIGRKITTPFLDEEEPHKNDPKNRIFLSYFDIILPDIGGNCNQKLNCRVLPVAKKFLSDRNGIRQYVPSYMNLSYCRIPFLSDRTFNITPFLHASEKIYYKFMDDLNRYGYCSSYA